MSALLATVMLIAAVGPVTAFADMYIDMSAGGWLYRYYLNGVVELLEYAGSARNVTVPARIGMHTVSGFYARPVNGLPRHIVSGHNVESITFELRVGEIPQYFADNCPNLKSVTLPDTVETVGAKAPRAGSAEEPARFAEAPEQAATSVWRLILDLFERLIAFVTAAFSNTVLPK